MTLSWAGTPRDMRDALCARTGLPVACEMIDGQVAVEFIVLQDDDLKPWRKAFTLDPAMAVPDAFVSMLDKWREEMSRRMRVGEVRGTLLGAVIAEHGEEAVRKAIAKRILVLQ